MKIYSFMKQFGESARINQAANRGLFNHKNLLFGYKLYLSKILLPRVIANNT